MSEIHTTVVQIQTFSGRKSASKSFAGKKKTSKKSGFRRFTVITFTFTLIYQEGIESCGKLSPETILYLTGPQIKFIFT